MLLSQSSARNNMLNATRGEALQSEEKQDIMRRATTGGIMLLPFDEPRALAGRLAATAIAELPICLLLNDPMLCLKLCSSAVSVTEPYVDVSKQQKISQT
jgi:hypothetical protein